jgi:hypothetical protein
MYIAKKHFEFSRDGFTCEVATVGSPVDLPDDLAEGLLSAGYVDFASEKAAGNEDEVKRRGRPPGPSKA